MNKIWLLAVGVGMAVLLGVAGLTAGLTAHSPVEAATSPPISVSIPNQQTGISVSGTGKVTATPDVAIVQLGVSAQASTVAEAQSQASQAMDKVMTTLTGNGGAQKDIKTQQFSITQVTRYDDKTQTQVVVGYRVDNTVTAKIRAVSKAGTVIDAVAAAGGDLTRINGISFTVDDPTGLTAQARDMAMADAKAKAQQLAKDSGVTLGKPTFISESSYIPYQPVPMAADARSAGVATPISPGETDVTVTVQVSYAIVD